ncbi:MAG TPA: hypothetical protein VFC53_10920 [Dehalococcoidia bacterium]|nr:hypothetical protein [Dehalococcoidia bacterium]
MDTLYTLAVNGLAARGFDDRNRRGAAQKDRAAAAREKVERAERQQAIERYRLSLLEPLFFSYGIIAV